MKPLFKNTTKYSKENFNNLLEFHKNKFGVKIIISTLITLILYLYIFIQNIVYNNWKMLILIVICTIVFFICRKIIKFVKKQIERKQKKSDKNKNYIYNFYQYHFKVKTEKKGQTVFYFRLYKVYETKDCFYLYTDKDHSFIVSKDGFIIGNSEKFSKFIRKKCILKYKNETK